MNKYHGGGRLGLGPTMKRLILSFGLCITLPTYAFHWKDLWVSRDRQAEAMMQARQYQAAEKTFVRPDWQATAAYRAGNYQQAAKQYQQLNNPYNEGNALAYLGQYQQAIQAYTKALALDPHNQDAKHNRQVVEALLKQSQQQKQPDSKDQQKDQSEQPQSDSANKSDQEEQAKPEDKQDKENKENKEAEQPKEAEQSEQQKEQQQNKDQWLRLIPDDPGGLLREKFLRDYLRRQRE